MRHHRSDRRGERSDIFSAGAVLYEMATGCRAFPQRDPGTLVEAIQYADPLDPSTLNPWVPEALSRVIVRAIEKDPRARQPTAEHLALDLELLTPARRAASGDVRDGEARSVLVRAGV